MPAARARSRSAAPAWALTPTMRAPSTRSRRGWTKLVPSPSGRARSRMMALNSLAPAWASASAPVAAAAQSAPCSVRKAMKSSRTSGLSSTTRTRRPWRAVGISAGLSDSSGVARGARTTAVKQEPVTPSLATPSSPPMARQSAAESASPSPEPSLSAVSSSREKATKSRLCSAGGMPGPVSRTVRTSRSGLSARKATVTPPRSVNLSALPTRLVSTCRKRSASSETAGGTPPSIKQARFNCRDSARGRKLSTAWETRSAGLTVRAASWNAPASMALKSRRSLTSRVISSPCWRNAMSQPVAFGSSATRWRRSSL